MRFITAYQAQYEPGCKRLDHGCKGLESLGKLESFWTLLRDILLDGLDSSLQGQHDQLWLEGAVQLVVLKRDAW